MEKSDSFYNFLAFISYSHKDTRIAKYIESELKKYKLPLIISQNHPELKKLRFDQIFRDENNFGNGSLEDQIKFGLQNSRFLISICSPNYAKANNNDINWCDEEVKQFLKYNNGDFTRIIPIIIDGVPHTDNECFPPSLLNLNCGEGETKEALGISALNIKDILQDNCSEEKPSLTASEHIIKDDIFDSIKARLLGLNYGVYKTYAHQVRYFKDYVDCWSIPKGIGEYKNGEWEHTNHYKFIYKEDFLYEIRYENGSGVIIQNEDSEDQEKIINAVFVYDDKGNLIKVEHKNSKGQIARVDKFEKNFTVINFYDKNSDSTRLLSANFTVAGGELSGSKAEKSEIKSIRLVRDKNGFIIKKTFHKYHNEIFPVCDNNGNNGIEYENDERGRATKLFYLDIEGNKKLNHLGICGKAYEYDDKDNRIKESFINEKNELVQNNENYAQLKIKHDQYGRVIEETVYDSSCNRTTIYEGVYKFCRKYDEIGNTIETSFLDENDKLINKPDGVAKFCQKYDENSNNTEITYFDQNNSRLLYKNSYHKLCMKYDNHNNKIETTYYGINNEPVLSPNKVAKWCGKYDNRGNKIEVAYFGLDNQPACNKNNIARWCCEFDDFNNRISMSYYGANNEPILRKEGFSKWHTKYDERGNEIENSYFDTESKPVLIDRGISKETYVYDTQSNLTQINYFGLDNKPCMCTDGWSSNKKIYDMYNNCIQTIFYDTDGNEIRREYGE